MTQEELKAALQEEVGALKESIKHFAKSEDIQKEIDTLKKSVEANNIKGLEEKFDELNKAAEVQGLLLKQIQENGKKTEKTFKESYVEKIEAINKMIESGHGKVSMNTTRKAVSAASNTSDTWFQRTEGVGQIQRGMPWLRDLFNVVTLGSNSHGSITWKEQLAVTNNAANVAESAHPATGSDLTWVEKTLAGKRVKDWIKVSKDQIKDVDYVSAEIQALVNKNMRLQENSQLYSGTGLTNYVKGINTYATEFDTTGVVVPKANIFDLIQKVATQIKVSSLDGFMPGVLCLNPAQVDLMRLAKNVDGDYLFPQWAIGGMPSIAGLQLVENSLVTANTALVGDFNYGTIFEWDGLTIEIGQEGDDLLNGDVTIVAYERINLRVKDTDLNAFRKVSDIATVIGTINEPVA